MITEPQLFPSNVPGRQYREREIIGQGGESLVYKAVQVDNGIEGPLVAVKECSQKRTPQQGWKIYDRFKRQADFMQQLKHPNIVDFHEFVEGEGRFLELYLVMEFLEGQNLSQYLHTNGSGAGRALPLDELVRVNEQVIGALEHAHSKNIVHRDLKPEQIMILPDGMVKLLDFGSGKAISGGDTATLLTSAGATYQYAAPEQFGFFKENYSPATDAYAFSVMLYEMLTGSQLPRSDENFHHTIPNGVNLGRFREVIKRGITWEPDKRATLEEFRRVIGREKRAPAHLDDAIDAEFEEVPQPQLLPPSTALAKPTTSIENGLTQYNFMYAHEKEVTGNLVNHIGGLSIVHTVGGDQLAYIGAVNYAHKVGGDQSAGIGAVNIAREVGGNQFAGIGAAVNIAHEVGKDQVAVIGAAINYAHKVGRDQVAGFGAAINYASEVGRDQWALFGPAVNYAHKVGGDQLAGFGAVNIAHEVGGDQGAVTGCAINVAKRVGKGQYGLVNIVTEELGERQVGIINYADGEEFRQYGLLNLRPGKRWRWNVEISLLYHRRKRSEE